MLYTVDASVNSSQPLQPLLDAAFGGSFANFALLYSN